MAFFIFVTFSERVELGKNDIIMAIRKAGIQMKKFLKYSGIAAAVIAVVGLILMMTTAGLQYVGQNETYFVAGSTLIFGSTEQINMTLGSLAINLGESKIAGSATALIGFILAAIGVVALILGALLPVLKVRALEKFAGLINLIALGTLVVAGIMMFTAQPAFAAANEFTVMNKKVQIYKDYTVTFTWVLSAILLILAGVLAIFPAAMDFIGGKKKKK